MKRNFSRKDKLLLGALFVGLLLLTAVLQVTHASNDVRRLGWILFSVVAVAVYLVLVWREK